MGMGDGYWSDGLRVQGFLARDNVSRRRYPAPYNMGPSLAVVTAVHYKDQETNIRRQFTEYDVMLVQHRIPIRNISTMSDFIGAEQGYEVTYTPADELPDLSIPESVWNAVFDSGGDLVAVTWIDGTWPVICGCLNHIKTSQDGTPWACDSTTGPRNYMKYNNVEAQIDNNENIRIDLPDEKSLEVYVNGTLALKVFNDASNVRVDMGNGAEAIILGESFQTWWDNNVANHVHPAGSLQDSTPAPCTGATGPMGENFDSSTLSDITKTE